MIPLWVLRDSPSSGDSPSPVLICFNLKNIHNVIEVPETPYYVFDVDIGLKTLGKTPQEAEKSLDITRSNLSVCEVISLCIHTNTLSTHSVFASNSRYGGHECEVVVLMLNNGLQTPELGRWIISKAHPRCCSASCRLPRFSLIEK